MNRRELFSSLASPFKKNEKQEKIIRPPYYKKGADFLTYCQTCNGECLKACELNIIIIQKDSTPKLDFSTSGCTFCDECAKHCPTGILDIQYKKNIDIKITINTSQCLSWNQVMCFSCKDPCLDEAIDFSAMFKPTINDKCTSCGFCIRICPTNAIKIGE